jgi:probable phosphoglycerate mutase
VQSGYDGAAAEVVVLRHGRTASNATGRLQGQLDVPLDDVGRAQAVAVADQLLGAGITAVVSSDLSRARSTADTLGARLGLPVELDARLREQHYGAWQGRTRDEVEDLWPEAHAAWVAGQGDPVGGEPLADVGERALAAVLAALPGSGTLLVVTHGDTARALLARVQGVPLRDAPALDNCGYARAEVREIVVRA